MAAHSQGTAIFEHRADPGTLERRIRAWRRRERRMRPRSVQLSNEQKAKRSKKIKSKAG
jgi:hypothetical protein